MVNCSDHQDLSQNYGTRIRLATINSCTGMEAGVVFVLGVSHLLNALNNLNLDEEERRALYQEQTRKLYVAMTRAGQKLVLFSAEKLPAHVAQYVTVA